MEKYNLVVAGGTFDHFHKGHTEFLRFIAKRSNHALLGITSDAFLVNSGKTGKLEDYTSRLKHVKEFLQSERLLERFTLLPIESSDIPSEWQDLPIEAIFVTQDTKKEQIILIVCS